MDYITPCLISIIFISGLLYLKLVSNKDNVISNFRNSLSPELKQKYKNIASERKNIYITGIIYGLAISIILLLSVPKKIKSNPICFSLSIVLVFSYIYYIITPKSDYIILYLNNQIDRQNWLKVYKYMQFNYHLGISFGILIVTMLWFAK